MDSTLDSITNFWRWFSDHKSELAANHIPQVLIDELEGRLFAIHRLDWEIGPGVNAPSSFALSPSGNRQNLHLTRIVVARAPKLDGWEFHPAKPVKRWNLVFNLMVNQEGIEIDGKLWEFVAYKFKDMTYDLIFKPNTSKGLSDDYLAWAATIIADGELGEARRMDFVQNITTVATWDTKAAQFARRLEPGLLMNVIKQ